MNAKLAPTAAPSYAVKMWTDGRSVLVELPSKTIPCILSFPLTESGLNRALNLLRQRNTDFAGAIESSTRPLVGTPLQHALAQRILKQKGVIR